MTSKGQRLLAIPVILLLVLFAVSCKKSTYYQLTDEDMAWLVYDNNQIDNFKNPSNDITSIKVQRRSKAYEKTGQTYTEYTSAAFHQLDDSTLYVQDSKGSLWIEKNENGLIVTLTWPHFPLQDLQINHLVPTSATIGGFLYDDIFILDATGLTDSRKYIQIVWYSRGSGVVQYQDRDGIIWTRVN
jgi:hypothetical protein